MAARYAPSVYQDLIEGFGVSHRHDWVKRFARSLKVREPNRFDVLESERVEEARIDFGLGASTIYRNGKNRKPILL